MELTLQPKFQVTSDPSQYGPGSVSVRCLGPDVLAFLWNGTQPSDLLKSVFRVAVAQAPSSGRDNFPDVFGRFELLKDGIRFIPHFPFERGVKYFAIFDPELLGAISPAESLTLEFMIPSEQNEAAPTEVTNIFPSSDLLPENLLRFYVCFSNPMRRGRVLGEIALFDAEGKPAADALYRAPVELWDRTMRRLTVLLDPGRLKRWVGPNVELGPPLKAGEKYILEVGAGLTDLYGRPLGASFRKHFIVGEPIREPISVGSWQIVSPLAGSRQPLVLTFPEPLDWALLFHTIKIQSADGLAMDGRIIIDQCETRWTFTPTSPWKSGFYFLRVESGLEDVCGNNLTGAFDRLLRTELNLAREVNGSSVCFQVR
jgi:hypothetical protein